MKKNDKYFLLIGTILLFFSLYLFTRPAIFSVFDFSNTGAIGDTIGGITAPIINIIGAYLVYISFKTQLDANKIQIKALNDEKERFSNQSVYQNHINHFEEIKSTLRNVEFIVELNPSFNTDGSSTYFAPLIFKGLNALNEFKNRLTNKVAKYGERYETYGMLLSYQFMLTSVVDLIENIEKTTTDINEKKYLLKSIKLFYESFLRPFAIEMESRKDRIDADTDITKIISLRNDIDNKYNE